MATILYADLPAVNKDRIQYGFRRLREAMAKVAEALQEARQAVSVFALTTVALTVNGDSVDGGEVIPNESQGPVSPVADMESFNLASLTNSELLEFIVEQTETNRHLALVWALGPEAVA